MGQYEQGETVGPAGHGKPQFHRVFVDAFRPERFQTGTKPVQCIVGQAEISCS